MEIDTEVFFVDTDEFIVEFLQPPDVLNFCLLVIFSSICTCLASSQSITSTRSRMKEFEVHSNSFFLRFFV